MGAGGKREGAGRKRVDPSVKKVQMIVYISPATRDKLKTLAKSKGVAPGRVIEELLDN